MNRDDIYAKMDTSDTPVVGAATSTMFIATSTTPPSPAAVTAPTAIITATTVITPTRAISSLHVPCDTSTSPPQPPIANTGNTQSNNPGTSTRRGKLAAPAIVGKGLTDKFVVSPLLSKPSIDI